MTKIRSHVIDAPPNRPDSKAKHGWMMIACCIPMVAIAIVLVATGVVSTGFLFLAIMCTVMMAMMMRSMNHGAKGS